MKIKRIITGLLVLALFCTASFNIGVKYKNNQIYNYERKLFLNETYYEINKMIYLLSLVTKADESKNAAEKRIEDYNAMLEELKKAGQYVHSASYFKSENGNFIFELDQTYNLLESCISHGKYFDGIFICNGFLNDGVLSDNERLFLISLQEDFQSIKDKMYDSKTKQENPNLSMNEMGKIFKSFVEKYSIDNISNFKLDN